MTPFAAVLARLGLSQAEAAVALGVPLDTLKSWSSGRRRVPPRIWTALATLARQRGADCVALAAEIERRAA